MTTRILRRIACLAIALGMAVLGTPSSAEANMRLELALTNNGGVSYTGTVLTDSANSGVLTFIGPIGNWGTNVTTGASAPPLTPPPGVIALLDLNTLNIKSGSAGTMTIILENAGYTAAAGKLLVTGDIGGTITAGGSVTATGWVSPTNAVPALPANQPVGPIAAPPPVPAAAGDVNDLTLTTSARSFMKTSSANFINTGTFSLYKKIVVTFGAGGGLFSADFSDAVSPEPSTMALAGLGALGLIGYGLRRRKALGV